MLKLGCTLPDLSNNCSHKSTDAKFYPSTERDENLLKNLEKTSLVVHLSFFYAKQLMMKPFFQSLQAYANVKLGLLPTIPLLMCQPMLSGP